MRTICLGNEIRPHISNFVEVSRMKSYLVNMVNVVDTLKMKGWEDGVEIRKFEEPSCWRMTQSDANGIFEVILHMQGVIEDKKLPPIRGEL